MIWARIVENEIIEIQDIDPATLYHPDLLSEWKSVPDYCHVGWRYKNNKWISGSQWHDEFMAENPVPPPGPPHATYAKIEAVPYDTTVKYKLGIVPSGIFDSFEVEVNGNKTTEEILEFTVERKSEDYSIPVKIKVKGPGGEAVLEYTGEEGIFVPAVRN